MNSINFKHLENQGEIRRFNTKWQKYLAIVVTLWTLFTIVGFSYVVYSISTIREDTHKFTKKAGKLIDITEEIAIKANFSVDTLVKDIHNTLTGAEEFADSMETYVYKALIDTEDFTNFIKEITKEFVKSSNGVKSDIHNVSLSIEDLIKTGKDLATGDVNPKETLGLTKVISHILVPWICKEAKKQHSWLMVGVNCDYYGNNK